MIRLLALVALLTPLIGIAEPLRVFVSVLPLKTFVEKVGGEHVQVQVMVGPGFNPHTYDPTPHQVASLSNAALYVRAGVPFEHAWMARIRSANPGRACGSWRPWTRCCCCPLAPITASSSPSPSTRSLLGCAVSQ